MLRHLPESALLALCHIINKHWSSESFPISSSIWQHAVVLPVPKADKDKTDPCSYRPIPLTSCLCKIVERMINDRLVWYLNKSCWFSLFFCEKCVLAENEGIDFGQDTFSYARRKKRIQFVQWNVRPRQRIISSQLPVLSSLIVLLSEVGPATAMHELSL